jgi:hypothetical protein
VRHRQKRKQPKKDPGHCKEEQPSVTNDHERWVKGAVTASFEGYYLESYDSNPLVESRSKKFSWSSIVGNENKNDPFLTRIHLPKHGMMDWTIDQQQNSHKKGPWTPMKAMVNNDEEEDQQKVEIPRRMSQNQRVNQNLGNGRIRDKHGKS